MSQQTADLPQEVEALWGQLHEEAQARYNDLAPPMHKGFVFASVAAAILILLGGGWGANKFYFQPKETTRQARSSTQAAAQEIAVRRTEDALDTAAAVTATALDESVQKTQTAVAVDARATATKKEANTQATATAQSATITAEAVKLRCQDIRLYALEVSTPTISPRSGTLYVIGNPMRAVLATWIITNTGECAWNTIALRTWPQLEPVDEGTQAGTFQVRRDGEDEEGIPVASGDAIEVVVYFSATQAQSVSQEWVLRVNDLPVLSEQPHLRLEAENWVISVTPTPTPTSTPTPTHTPQPPHDNGGNQQDDQQKKDAPPLPPSE